MSGPCLEVEEKKALVQSLKGIVDALDSSRLVLRLLTKRLLGLIR